MIKGKRPTFTCSKGDIRAGGVLYYYFNLSNNRLEILLTQYQKGLYEDFGGKTDAGDINIQDTISREVSEESNNIFNRKKTNKILKRISYTYVPDSKYAVYFVELKFRIPEKKFGNVETFLNYERNVNWVDYNDIKYSKLNARLRSKYVKKRLSYIKYQFDLTYQLFKQFKNRQIINIIKRYL